MNYFTPSGPGFWAASSAMRVRTLFFILLAAFLCGCSYSYIGQDSGASPDGRFRAATALTDRGFKHVADTHLGGRDIHLCPGEIFSRTLSFPVSAGDAGTWAAWLFLEDIRTDGTNAQQVSAVNYPAPSTIWQTAGWSLWPVRRS